MQRRPFSRGELLFLIGVPLAWAVLLLFHPGGEGDEIYQDLQDKVTRWMVVHIGMMLFIPLFGAVVYLLMRGIEGTAALVSRIGLALFVVFYGAFELLQGIGVGILVNEANGLPHNGAGRPGSGLRRASDCSPTSVSSAASEAWGCLSRWSPLALLFAATLVRHLRFGLARPFGVSDRCASAALRTHRPSALHCGRLAFPAKPSGSRSSCSAGPARSRLAARRHRTGERSPATSPAQYPGRRGEA